MNVIQLWMLMASLEADIAEGTSNPVHKDPEQEAKNTLLQYPNQGDKMHWNWYYIFNFLWFITKYLINIITNKNK